jgi:hypothetical protein
VDGLTQKIGRDRGVTAGALDIRNGNRQATEMSFGTFRAKASYGIALISNPSAGIAFAHSLVEQIREQRHWQTAIVALERAEKDDTLEDDAWRSLDNALETDGLLFASSSPTLNPKAAREAYSAE